MNFKVIIIFLLLFTSSAFADFFGAQKKFNEGNYTEAFNEFKTLAKFGNVKSQHNVAVMLYKGMGIKKNLIEAYAWSRISDGNNNNSVLSKIIYKELTDKQREKARQLENEFSNKYSFENSKIILGPTHINNNNNITSKDLVRLNNIAPTYPTNMALKKIDGSVDSMFDVYPDGSVKDIQIIGEVPANGEFARETIKYLSLSKFAFEKDGKLIKIKEPISISQRTDFRIKSPNKKFPKQIMKDIDELKTSALNGDINSQYEYAFLHETLLNNDSDVDQNQINTWLFNAAIHGIPNAQFRLGRNIFYGNSSKVNKQKGFDWIMTAALAGNKNAEFMAYQMLKNNQVVNQSKHSAFYWLEQAAKNGLNIAQLRFAYEVATMETPNKKQLKLAKKYLKYYKKNATRTIQWYETKALLSVKTKKFMTALHSINKAIKMAKSAGLSTDELEKTKSTIISLKKL